MINKILKTLRLEKGISQQFLANKFNISRQAISHYESGYIEPNLEILKKYCIFFDVSADELLEIETAEERKKVIINNSFNNNSGKQNIKF